jgi:hypothetical protein
MEEDDSTFLRYLIAEDWPNYELLLDDDNEEMAAMVASMEDESSFHRSAHVRRLVPRDHADGEARIIRHYFAANPVYTPEQFRRRYKTCHIVVFSVNMCILLTFPNLQVPDEASCVPPHSRWSSVSGYIFPTT